MSTVVSLVTGRGRVGTRWQRIRLRVSRIVDADQSGEAGGEPTFEQLGTVPAWIRRRGLPRQGPEARDRRGDGCRARCGWPSVACRCRGVGRGRPAVPNCPRRGAASIRS